jgi:hypothetical protein
LYLEELSIRSALYICCRTLDAYWEYAQIDIKERKANSAAKFCRKHAKRRPPPPEAAAQPPPRKGLRAKLTVKHAQPRLP